MRIGEVMDISKNYDIYDYGHDSIIKLFKRDHAKEFVSNEYKNNLHVNEVFRQSLKALEQVQVDERHGIIFKKTQGKTLLYLLEEEPTLLQEVAEIFASFHAQLHEKRSMNLIDQTAYYDKHIERCKYLSETQKKQLKKEVRDLPQGETLCHGNYHLNQVLMTDEPILMGFCNAYRGHPLSDVAKACIIIDVPRPIANASSSFNEEVTKLRQHLLDLYLNHYKATAYFDESVLEQFIKFAAITRLNENHDHEREWLLNIINS